MIPNMKEFIQAIPKTDLHMHLDGSLRVETLIELAREQDVKLPSYTVEGLNELVFKTNYNDLNEYLKGFGLTCAVMREKESLERIAYELAMDTFSEGVRYIEVRFAPQLNMADNLEFEDVMRAVDDGLRRARNEINSKLPADEPPFDYGIIVCAMRFFNEQFSPYYADFYRVHRHSNAQEITQFASMELAKATIKLRDTSDIQIVGFDLAGSEYGFPAGNHAKAYEYVHKHFLMKTVHAGEAYGPESIFQAITKLHADRIGHGLHLFDRNLISNPAADKDKYITDLVNYIAEKRITIEVCLTSNLQTMPGLKLENHSFRKMLEYELSVTLCTDNRLVSHTSVTNELLLAANTFKITPKQLKNITVYGFKRSFFYQPYSRKKEYVRKVMDYYEKLEKKYGINSK